MHQKAKDYVIENRMINTKFLNILDKQMSENMLKVKGWGCFSIKSTSLTKEDLKYLRQES